MTRCGKIDCFSPLFLYLGQSLSVMSRFVQSTCSGQNIASSAIAGFVALDSTLVLCLRDPCILIMWFMGKFCPARDQHEESEASRHVVLHAGRLVERAVIRVYWHDCQEHSGRGNANSRIQDGDPVRLHWNAQRYSQYWEQARCRLNDRHAPVNTTQAERSDSTTPRVEAEKAGVPK